MTTKRTYPEAGDAAAEIEAMQLVTFALKPLTLDARTRVLGWVLHRLNSEEMAGQPVADPAAELFKLFGRPT